MHLVGQNRVTKGYRKGLIHGGVRKSESFLHEVSSQHGLKSKRRSAIFPLGVVRGDELDQLALAGLLVTQVQIKTALFH
jgi:hypothetical protein